jgi:hypothetical protein
LSKTLWEHQNMGSSKMECPESNANPQTEVGPLLICLLCLRGLLTALLLLFCLVLICLVLPGCASSHPDGMTATKAELKRSQPDYWWNQPAVVHVSARDFYKLWNACKGELYVRLFIVDREQYRDGLLTSEPLVSKQFFEFWRTDAVTVHDVAESSLATMRRIVRFEVTKQKDGSYDMVPKVLVERFESTERRLTAFNQYHESFTAPRTYMDEPDESGVQLAADYWYVVRRDSDLEKDLANSIKRRLEHSE